MKLMAFLKNMKRHDKFTFPDGTILKGSDVVEEGVSGRKVVICGDTNDATALEGLAQGCDILIHEATNAYFPEMEVGKTYRDIQADAFRHGKCAARVGRSFAMLRCTEKKIIYLLTRMKH